MFLPQLGAIIMKPDTIPQEFSDEVLDAIAGGARSTANISEINVFVEQTLASTSAQAGAYLRAILSDAKAANGEKKALR